MKLISTIAGGCATLENSADLDGKNLRNLDANPFIPRRMSVAPVANHTRTPEGTGIIAQPKP